MKICYQIYCYCEIKLNTNFETSIWNGDVETTDIKQSPFKHFVTLSLYAISIPYLALWIKKG